jgi:hypothetical protein
MDEYVIVPKRMMEVQLNKEPPEALEVLSLDNLTNKILKRNDISEWEKASMLTSTLERFLALRPKAFPEPLPAEPPAKRPRPSRAAARPRALPDQRFASAMSHSPERPVRNRTKPLRYQEGSGWISW